MKQDNDLLDRLFNFAGSFDWMWPLINQAGGYTVLEYSGSYEGALAHKIALEGQGVPCRLEGGGLFTNSCVYTRPERIGGGK